MLSVIEQILYILYYLKIVSYEFCLALIFLSLLQIIGSAKPTYTSHHCLCLMQRLQ